MNKKDSKLSGLLQWVRSIQQFLAILAELLILLAFAMSGMDVSLGGVMTRYEWVKWAWAAILALGLDTMFVLSWVRVRQAAMGRQWGSLFWNVLLAVGMSFIVFQPVAIQLLQQSLMIDFNQSLGELGINIVILVYARSLVAVLLGAILAMTNVEREQEEKPVQRVKRKIVIFEQVLNKIAPVVSSEVVSVASSTEVATDNLATGNVATSSVVNVATLEVATDNFVNPDNVVTGPIATFSDIATSDSGEPVNKVALSTNNVETDNTSSSTVNAAPHRAKLQLINTHNVETDSIEAVNVASPTVNVALSSRQRVFNFLENNNNARVCDIVGSCNVDKSQASRLRKEWGQSFNNVAEN